MRGTSLAAEDRRRGSLHDFCGDMRLRALLALAGARLNFSVSNTKLFDDIGARTTRIVFFDGGARLIVPYGSMLMCGGATPERATGSGMGFGGTILSSTTRRVALSP